MFDALPTSDPHSVSHVDQPWLAASAGGCARRAGRPVGTSSPPLTLVRTSWTIVTGTHQLLGVEGGELWRKESCLEAVPSGP